MIFCVDAGNSHTCCGIFDQDNQLMLQFQYPTKQLGTVDQFGIFLYQVLQANNLHVNVGFHVGISSVVPHINYIIKGAFEKYFNVLSLVFISHGMQHNLNIMTNHPEELGNDLLASAVAATNLYSQRNVLVFSFGTATTCCYINQFKELLGVSIAPGLMIMAKSLQHNTANLLSVDINTACTVIGADTKQSIQSGIFYAQLGFVQQTIKDVIQEFKLESTPAIIATGGFAKIFAKKHIFDAIIPELVLMGIKELVTR
jgi:type III pantothenate kinase